MEEERERTQWLGWSRQKQKIHSLSPRWKAGNTGSGGNTKGGGRRKSVGGGGERNRRQHIVNVAQKRNIQTPTIMGGKKRIIIFYRCDAITV